LGVRAKGAGLQYLYTEQRARIERLARGRGSLAGSAAPPSYAATATHVPTLATASGSICGALMRTPSCK
jgi:hypothetical protein